MVEGFADTSWPPEPGGDGPEGSSRKPRDEREVKTRNSNVDSKSMVTFQALNPREKNHRMLTLGLRESFKAKEFSQDKISVQEFFHYRRKKSHFYCTKRTEGKSLHYLRLGSVERIQLQKVTQGHFKWANSMAYES